MHEVSEKQGNLHRSVPTQLRIEVAQGCTRQCDFCGICTVGNKIRLMSRETMDKIVEHLPLGTKRIDFALHGEPLLNKDLPYFIKKLRAKSPKVQISILSNGDIVSRVNKNGEYVLELFEAGLNFLHVDMYDKESGELFLSALRKNKDDFVKKGIAIKNFYSIDYNVWTYHGGKSKEILFCNEYDISNRKYKVTRHLHNWAGNMTVEKLREFKIPFKTVYTKCCEPFKSISITCDGKYMMCCMDFSKSLLVGDVLDTSIEEIWDSEIMQKIRWVLENKRRDLIPLCSICTRKSFRAQLYYYRGKKYDLEEVSKEISKMNFLSPHQLKIKEMYDEQIS